MDNQLLNNKMLIMAYRIGYFPMYIDGEHHFILPEVRTLLPMADIHVPRRLLRTIKQAPFELTINRDFQSVITNCAAPAPGRESTWLSEELIDVYINMHEAGVAHSVEAWQNGQLAGGLFGIAIGGLFAGESMFSKIRDASKVCLVTLAWRLAERGYKLFDVQFSTDHLARFGAYEISRFEYNERLKNVIDLDIKFVDSCCSDRCKNDIQKNI